MFERFTERARQVVAAAGDEARELRHGHIGSEHLLLGLLRDPDCVAARALASLDMSLEDARRALVGHVPSAEGPPTDGQLPFTPRGKQVLERAGAEAGALGHNYVGTEHILLALSRVSDGVAANILDDFDVDSPKIRDAVMGLLSGSFPPPDSRRAWPRMVRRHTARAAVTEQSPSPWTISVNPDGEVLRLLMSAAARSLEDGRTEMTIGDLLTALSRTEHLSAVLAELGVDETAIRAALQRLLRPEEPPEAASGG